MQPNKVWTLAAIGLLAVAAACSGGGSRSTPLIPGQTQPQNSAGKNLAIHFSVPGSGTMAKSRSLQFIQHNILGVVATITQASPSPSSTVLVDQEQFDVSGPPNCNASYPSTRACVFYVSAKAGIDNVEIDTYDTTHNTPGQIATPAATPTACVTKEISGQTTYKPTNCVEVGVAHALSVGIATGVTITAGTVNNVSLNLQPIADSFQMNGQPVYTLFSFPLCDPQLIASPLAAPQQHTCSEDQFDPATVGSTVVSGGGQSGSTSGRPEYVVSFNGNQALAFIPAPIGYPGIQPEDGSLAPVDSGLAAGLSCGPADNWYNPFSVYFFEGGTIATTFTNSGQLFKQACGFSYHSIASNGGQQTDTQFSIDDRYEEVYDGNGQPGNYNANGTVVAGGEGNANGGSVPGTGAYFGVINFAPAPVDSSPANPETPNAAAFLGPLPVICGGCSASAPGNDPVGGLGVGYQFHYADWRQASFDIAPLYGAVVADSRCGNPTNFGPFVCGGTLPANDDTANGHTATLVLGGYGELGVIVLAQFWPPTGYSAYTLTLSAGCPGDLQVSVPRNGINALGPFPGYTDNGGKATFGGQIFVIQAGRTLFTASANCFAVLSDSFTTSTTGVNAPNGQILITNPSTTSAFPGTITFP